MVEGNEQDTKLTVLSEDGKEITIDVIDIFNFEDNTTEYILYSIEDNIYASILLEDDNSYTLKTIDNKEDYARVMMRIDELISEE